MATNLFVIGGAVGVSWGGPAGWAAFIYLPETKASHRMAEAVPHATQHQADALPFAAAIQWYHDKHRGITPKPEILCLSDNELLVNEGNNPTFRRYDLDENWKYVRWLEERGYRISWLWDHRNRNMDVFCEATRVRDLFIKSMPPVA